MGRVRAGGFDPYFRRRRVLLRSAWGGEAKVGHERYGIQGRGDSAGGYFEDPFSGAYAFVGRDTWKIQGTGAVSFVQNHPDDASKVIVYTAPESSDVATFTRGSAQLDGGRGARRARPDLRLGDQPGDRPDGAPDAARRRGRAGGAVDHQREPRRRRAPRLRRVVRLPRVRSQARLRGDGSRPAEAVRRLDPLDEVPPRPARRTAGAGALRGRDALPRDDAGRGRRRARRPGRPAQAAGPRVRSGDGQRPADGVGRRGAGTG